MVFMTFHLCILTFNVLIFTFYLLVLNLNSSFCFQIQSYDFIISYFSLFKIWLFWFCISLFYIFNPWFCILALQFDILCMLLTFDRILTFYRPISYFLFWLEIHTCDNLFPNFDFLKSPHLEFLAHNYVF